MIEGIQPPDRITLVWKDAMPETLRSVQGLIASGEAYPVPPVQYICTSAETKYDRGAIVLTAEFKRS